MADVPGDGSREREDEKNRWFQDRSAGASRPQQDLENAGREAWNAATRAGIDLAARTPAELRALGWRILNAEHSAPATAGGISGARPRLSTHPGRAQPSVTTSQASNPLRPSTVGDGVREAAMQADAAIRGAANVLTFGGADHFAAGMNALIAPGGLDHLRQRYDANLAQEHARDRYDAANRATAQAIGQIGGTLLGLRLLGPANGALSAAPRIPGAATMTGREVAALLGGGALTGLATQTASDIAAGGRRSSFGDKAGAALGGAAGAAVLPLGPGQAGAVAGWVTSAAQDVLNGRPISLDRAGKSALAGDLLGGATGRFGTNASSRLPSSAKGRLGEAMGDVRSTVNGQRRTLAPKARDYISDHDYWYPDGTSGRLRFEDKFGYHAELSPNQTRAQAGLGQDFRLYHFTPDDIGGLVSVPAGSVSGQIFGGDNRYR